MSQTTPTDTVFNGDSTSDFITDVITTHDTNILTTTTTSVPSSPWTIRVILDFTSQIVLSVLVVAVNSMVLFTLYKVKTLRSRTNFVIGSLAVADMLTGLLVPLNAAHEVTDFHPNMCAAALGALTFGATVSMQHLMVISVDRFVAVRYPTRYRDIVTYKRLGVVVGIIWPLQFVLGFLPLFGVRNRDWDEVHCKLFELIAIWQLHLLIVVSVVCPLTIMSICYVRVFILSRRRFKRIQAMATTAAALSGWNQTMKKVKATAGLCVYFLLSWTPYGVIAAIMAATKQETVPPYWVDISLTVGFGNSFGNPVLYFLSQKSARDAVKETFWPKAKKHTPSVRLLTINVKPAAAGGTGSVATEGGSVSREGTRSTHV